MNELEIIRHRQIDGLSFFINTVDYRTPHMHPEWELIWVLSQPLSVSCEQSTFLLEEGQMILFHPNKPHELRKTEEGCTFLCIQAAPELLPISRQLITDRLLPHEFLTPEEMQQLRQQLVSVMCTYLKRPENYALYCVGQICLIFHTLLPKLAAHELTAGESAGIDRRNARLQRLIRFVDENYMHKIKLTDFAETEGCSMSHLSHFIKQAMNQTFQEYVNSVRFNRACQLMASGEKKMLDICVESGFSDYRYFARAFRQQYNMTPEEYSHYAKKLQLERAVVYRSLHSMERFYSREDSLQILQKYT